MLMKERPDLTEKLFGEMMALFGEGVLQPLPYRCFEAEDIVDAFRYMQQSRHIGKIVVTYKRGIHPVHAPPAGKAPARAVHGGQLYGHRRPERIRPQDCAVAGVKGCAQSGTWSAAAALAHPEHRRRSLHSKAPASGCTRLRAT